MREQDREKQLNYCFSDSIQEQDDKEGKRTSLIFSPMHMQVAYDGEMLVISNEFKACLLLDSYCRSRKMISKELRSRDLAHHFDTSLMSTAIKPYRCLSEGGLVT